MYDVLAVHDTYTLCDSPRCGEVIRVITDGHRFHADIESHWTTDTQAERDGTLLRVRCPRPETLRKLECTGSVTVDLTWSNWRAATDDDRRLLDHCNPDGIERID